MLTKAEPFTRMLKTIMAPALFSPFALPQKKDYMKKQKQRENWQ